MRIRGETREFACSLGIEQFVRQRQLKISTERYALRVPLDPRPDASAHWHVATTCSHRLHPYPVSKSAIKATSAEGAGQLFKWVAWFTSSRCAPFMMQLSQHGEQNFLGVGVKGLRARRCESGSA